jgi:hypothetical protein
MYQDAPVAPPVSMSAIPLRRKPPLAPVPETPERVDIPFLDCGPEIAMALGSGSSAFQDVVLAFFFGREDDNGENTLDCTPADRAVLRGNFNTLLRNFEAKHGRIERSYFARHCLAAAVLTCDDEIEVVLARDVPSSDLIQIIRRGQALGYQAWHRLEPRDRSLCQRMIFSVILEVLRRLDQSHQDGKRDGKLTYREVAHLNRNLEEAEDFMLRCATRRAQTEYLQGMLYQGSLLLVALLAVAVATWIVNGAFEGVFGQAVLVAIAGGLGASVSVLWRMTSGTFSINLPTLEYDSARSQLRVMGALRPAIGTIFALAVFVFAMSPILPLEDGSRGDTYFLVALGFLAGFSERFAQDMFVRSGQGLAGPGGDSPSSGLSAGLAPTPGGRGGGRAAG